MAKADSKSKVIVALDTPSLDVVKKLLKDLEGLITFYKVGFELFTAHGWDAVKLVRKFGGRIFLDLKFHDIPNTVAKTAAVVCEHEIDMFNLHALGGLEMMKAVKATVDERVKIGEKRPIILGVTVLTSHSEETLAKDLGVGRNINDQVLHLAGLVQKAGLDGVVCSPLETELVRKKLGADFKIVTPGIRGAKDVKGDQKRTFSAKEALEAGSDYIVIGRPITAAENPRREAESILKTL